jgi:hypothetical protein
MQNYILMNEENDLKYLHRKLKGNNYFSVKIYEKIHDEIIDYFGASNEYLSKLKDEIHIVLMKANNEDETFIDIALFEFEQKYNSKKETENSLRDAVIWIEKSQGVKISIKEITVFEFYHYIDFISRQNKL